MRKKGRIEIGAMVVVEVGERYKERYSKAEFCAMKMTNHALTPHHMLFQF
jgi:hypothetical protein